MTEPNTPDSVGARVRLAREHRGFGARELDRLAGLKNGHTSVIESRRGDIGGATAAKLAKALDVPERWLLSGGDVPWAVGADRAHRRTRRTGAQ